MVTEERELLRVASCALSTHSLMLYSIPPHEYTSIKPVGIARSLRGLGCRRSASCKNCYHSRKLCPKTMTLLHPTDGDDSNPDIGARILHPDASTSDELCMQDIISSVLEISPNYDRPNGLLFDLCWGNSLLYLLSFQERNCSVRNGDLDCIFCEISLTV
ncbi:hypothetical protein KQX54_005571 [Cotesia glomerata]|uniref:Uncharacterized protein n=1 Tax=Cotesia glomerata TaxID=32391 RepID=A0AAV7HBS5_COTGL|nr:hypothetical protein KQX54_005571 [Cotesia glomerata]